MAKVDKNTSREGKVYTLKSSARRAAKEDGLKENEFQVKQSARSEGWYYIRNGSKNVKTERSEEDLARIRKEAMEGDDHAIVETASVSEDVNLGAVMEAELVKANAALEGKGAAAVMESPALPRPVLKAVPNLDDDLIVRKPLVIQDYADPSTLVEEAPVVHSNPSFVAPVLSKVSDRPPPQLVIPPKSPKAKSHKSTVESPTKLVWHIADDMVAANKNVSRKEVIAECERQGVAHYTARTQYQQWLTAKRESDKNAGKVGQ